MSQFKLAALMKRQSRKRAGLDVRRKARRQMWAEATAIPVRYWIAMLIVIIAVAVVGNAALHRWANDWLAGLFTGILISSSACAVVWATMIQTGTASSMIGAEYESETASQLKMLSERGWTVVHDIHFPGRSNTDHVAIGPAGVLAFETKWMPPSDRDTGYQQTRLDEGATQSRMAARHLRLRLLAKPHLIRVDVAPVVVVWGGWRDRPDIAFIDSTPIVRGRALSQWLDELRTETLSTEVQSHAAAAMRSFINASEHRLDEQDALPMAVEHGAEVIAEGMMLSFVLILILFVLAKRVTLVAVLWPVILLLASVAARAVIPRIRLRSRFRAWLRTAALCWPLITACSFAYVLISQVLK